jgi:predicted nucleic acid-binding protein
MTKVFVDTDVCIDLLSGRKPFNKTAEILFSLADTGKIKIYISSLSFANIDYVLRSQYSTTHSRQIIAKFKTIVNVLPVDSKTIDLAIASDFNDFEDAIQYSCAIEP